MKTDIATQHRRDVDLGWRRCRDLPRIQHRYIYYEVTRFGKGGIEEHLRPPWDVRAGMRVTAIWLALDPQLRGLIETILVMFALFLFALVGLDVIHGWEAP